MVSLTDWRRREERVVVVVCIRPCNRVREWLLRKEKEVKEKGFVDSVRLVCSSCDSHVDWIALFSLPFSACFSSLSVYAFLTCSLYLSLSRSVFRTSEVVGKRKEGRKNMQTHMSAEESVFRSTSAVVRSPTCVSLSVCMYMWWSGSALDFVRCFQRGRRKTGAIQKNSFSLLKAFDLTHSTFSHW